MRYVLVPAVTIDTLPVPFNAMPLTDWLLMFRKLWLASPKNEFWKAPPVAGLMAMVQPPADVPTHSASDVVGGIVVFTRKEPSANVGLNMVCSYTCCELVSMLPVG